MKIQEILQQAYEYKASDIHMLPESPVMFRVNGKMTSMGGEYVSTEDFKKLIQELLTKSQIQELEQDGEVDTAVSVAGFSRIRMNIYRQQGTYGAAFRILSSTIPEPEELNLPESIVELTNENKGLVLITGEAGNGKTTTMASLLSLIARRDTKHIITIENPIEYLIPCENSLVSQREIGSDTKSYAKALKAALRQDPDVIFIGELSDVDTITEAIAAAESGHLVFSSLYTNRTEDTLHRLIDIFPTHRRQQIRVQLADVLKGVIAQQLIPRCDVDERRAVFEILLADKDIQALLREDRLSQIPAMMEKKKSAGMQTMDDAILSAYMKSQISGDTAVAYATNTELMKQRITIY